MLQNRALMTKAQITLAIGIGHLAHSPSKAPQAASRSLCNPASAVSEIVGFRDYGLEFVYSGISSTCSEPNLPGLQKCVKSGPKIHEEHKLSY